MNIPPRLAGLGQRVGIVAGDLAALLARLTIGQAFLQTGWGKLTHLERTAGFFTSLGIPAPGVHAVAIGGLELVGGGLLILGLLTRPIAFLLAGTMAVALLTADRDGFVAALAPWPDKGLTEVVPWMFLIPLLFLVAHGARRVALDHWLCRNPEQPPA